MGLIAEDSDSYFFLIFISFWDDRKKESDSHFNCRDLYLFFFGESRKKLTHILFVRIDIYFLDALASMLESQSVTD